MVTREKSEHKVKYDKRMLLAGALLMGVGIWSLTFPNILLGIVLTILGTIVFAMQMVARVKSR
jgi:hypothetical protein